MEPAAAGRLGDGGSSEWTGERLSPSIASSSPLRAWFSRPEPVLETASEQEEWLVRVRGLRVQVGIDSGPVTWVVPQPAAVLSYGGSVARKSRKLALAARPGQVLLSKRACAELVTDQIIDAAAAMSGGGGAAAASDAAAAASDALTRPPPRGHATQARSSAAGTAPRMWEASGEIELAVPPESLASPRIPDLDAAVLAQASAPLSPRQALPPASPQPRPVAVARVPLGRKNKSAGSKIFVCSNTTYTTTGSNSSANLELSGMLASELLASEQQPAARHASLRTMHPGGGEGAAISGASVAWGPAAATASRSAFAARSLGHPPGPAPLVPPINQDGHAPGGHGFGADAAAQEAQIRSASGTECRQPIAEPDAVWRAGGSHYGTGTGTGAGGDVGATRPLRLPASALSVFRVAAASLGHSAAAGGSAHSAGSPPLLPSADRATWGPSSRAGSIPRTGSSGHSSNNPAALWEVDDLLSPRGSREGRSSWAQFQGSLSAAALPHTSERSGPCSADSALGGGGGGGSRGGAAGVRGGAGGRGSMDTAADVVLTLGIDLAFVSDSRHSSSHRLRHAGGST
ncbi:hypothetical protein GPECTOR_1g794 [Gonium pectorale]|uniref:Uncharacterized protein n=1 Tax=Gonium pectorale TaxID=33097 RepID=A0A150H5I4_GONPE|nr:hypothetical protein GPECTOR_1g794 [Gonium pectorale]|eukprot:KXZ56880.1 hypothetical protein GPECTOR_1g794 [Gonium pectorale]